MEDEIKLKLEEAKQAEAELNKIESELALEPKFQQWLNAQKQLREANAKNEEFFNSLQEKMEDSGTKTIKGDWGSITLAERQGWDIDENELPKKFFKRVVNTKKITDTFKLEGKAPKGATPRVTKYLTKRFK